MAMDIIDSVHGPRAHVVTSINYLDSFYRDISIVYLLDIIMSMILIRLSYEDPSGHTQCHCILMYNTRVC